MDQKLAIACQKLQQENSLSETEHKIVSLLVQGLSPKDIASLRARSIETVRTQIKHILQKTCVSRMNMVVAQVYALVE